MIRFEHVSKRYHARGFEKEVLRDVGFTLERDAALGICGGNGAGKSTLLRLLAGVERPSGGRIFRTMSVSWPLGYSTCFQGSLTGADNIRFIARIYGRPAGDMIAQVEEFAQLGPYLRQPVKTYSAGMSARLAFGASLAVDFDCYLVDEITGAGDARFRARCAEEIARRRARAALVMVSHDSATLRQYCSTGAVLHDGRLTFYATIDEAIAVHERQQHGEPTQPHEALAAA